jgi:hypothetical protein
MVRNSLSCFSKDYGVDWRRKGCCQMREKKKDGQPFESDSQGNTVVWGSLFWPRDGFF